MSAIDKYYFHLIQTRDMLSEAAEARNPQAHGDAYNAAYARIFPRDSTLTPYENAIAETDTRPAVMRKIEHAEKCLLAYVEEVGSGFQTGGGFDNPVVMALNEAIVALRPFLESKVGVVTAGEQNKKPKQHVGRLPSDDSKAKQTHMLAMIRNIQA